MTLPSNVHNQYHDNKIGSYKTILPTTLRLTNEWKVGLAGIHYTNSWFNLKDYNEICLVKYDNNKIKYSNMSFLSPGRYSSLDDLLTDIMEKVTGNSLVAIKPKLSYNAFSRRITITYGRSRTKEYITYQLGQELKDLLGISSGFLSQEGMRLSAMPFKGDTNAITKSMRASINQPLTIYENDVLESLNAYDMRGGIHSILVYSDVVDFSVVGDIRAQMLRIVEVPSFSRFGDSVVFTYERPYFLPLATKEISSIEIDIKDDTGSPIDFKFGRVEVTLQFLKNG